MGLLLVLTNGIWHSAQAQLIDVTRADVVSAARFAGGSALETRLLEDAADQRLDEFSLFEAVLIAGGASDQILQQHARRLQAWGEALNRADHEAAGGSRQQAQVVFDFMHRSILVGNYREECTDLNSALDDGHYNCLSSAVLFHALAGRRGLKVEFVAQPAHVYCRVLGEEGALEVQTTNPRWFSGPSSPEWRSSGTLPVAGERVVNEMNLLGLLYYNRGVALLQRQQFPAALAANQHALLLDPANLAARANLLATYNNWAVDYGQRGHYEQALAVLRAALAVDPDHQPFHRNSLALYQQWISQQVAAGQVSQARSILDQALTTFPGDASLLTAQQTIAGLR